MECKTNEVSARSTVMKFSPDTGENPFAKMNELITGLITDVNNKLQSEASSEADAGDGPFAKVKDLVMDLITDSINRLQSEISHKPYCDDELTKASVNKEDREIQVATQSCKLETAVSEVAELHVGLGDQPQQLKIDPMRVDERKTSADLVLETSRDECFSCEEGHRLVRGGALVGQASVGTDR